MNVTRHPVSGRERGGVAHLVEQSALHVLAALTCSATRLRGSRRSWALLPALEADRRRRPRRRHPRHHQRQRPLLATPPAATRATCGSSSTATGRGRRSGGKRLASAHPSPAGAGCRAGLSLPRGPAAGADLDARGGAVVRGVGASYRRMTHLLQHSLRRIYRLRSRQLEGRSSHKLAGGGEVDP